MCLMEHFFVSERTTFGLRRWFKMKFWTVRFEKLERLLCNMTSLVHH